MGKGNTAATNTLVKGLILSNIFIYSLGIITTLSFKLFISHQLALLYVSNPSWGKIIIDPCKGLTNFCCPTKRHHNLMEEYRKTLDFQFLARKTRKHLAKSTLLKSKKKSTAESAD